MSAVTTLKNDEQEFDKDAGMTKTKGAAAAADLASDDEDEAEFLAKGPYINDVCKIFGLLITKSF